MAPQQEPKSSLKTFSFGGCRYDRTSPPRSELTSTTKAVNVHISFENALQLKAALDEAVRELNLYKRKSAEGVSNVLNLKLDFETPRVELTRGKAPVGK